MSKEESKRIIVLPKEEYEFANLILGRALGDREGMAVLASDYTKSIDRFWKEVRRLFPEVKTDENEWVAQFDHDKVIVTRKEND